MVCQALGLLVPLVRKACRNRPVERHMHDAALVLAERVGRAQAARLAGSRSEMPLSAQRLDVVCHRAHRQAEMRPDLP